MTGRCPPGGEVGFLSGVFFMRGCIAASVVLLVFSSPIAAADFAAEAQQNWHQWRGPNADGVSPQGKPPTEWTDEKNVKWKTAIPGRGSASPVVWGDRIFLLTAVDTGQPKEEAAAGEAATDEGVKQTSAEEPAASEAPAGETPATESAGEEPRGEEGRGERRGRGRFGRGGPGGFGGGFGRRSGPVNIQQYTVVCVDRTSGDILWQKVAREAAPLEAGHDTNTHASASATTDGKYVYCSFGSHGIYCYDLEGNLKWEKDLGDMTTRNGFGEGASPTIHGDTLVVSWDHESGSFITALDAATGEEKWKTPRDEVTTWNTPLVVEAAGRTQVVVNGTNRSRGYDLATGEQIWECGGQATNPIACCVTFDGLVYCMTGHRGSAVVAIPLDAEGDITGTEKVAWTSDLGAPYVPSPVLYGHRLYFHKSSNGILSCLDARDGTPLINQKRLPGIENVYASPVGAAGRVYLTGRDGTTLVIRDADELEVLATNTVGEAVDASPAIVGDEMFIRGEKHLFCISEQ